MPKGDVFCAMRGYARQDLIMAQCINVMGRAVWVINDANTFPVSLLAGKRLA